MPSIRFDEAKTAKPLDLTHVERQLCPEGSSPPEDLTWLHASYDDPGAFWLSLQKAQAAFFDNAAKSTACVGYDFYYDIVCRNLESETPAFRYYDVLHGWRECSYRELGEAATQKSLAWTETGASAGQKVCIIQPLGPEVVISLLAALKMGLVISLLPPLGRRFVGRRLANLSPDHIDTDEGCLPLLGSWEDRVLPTSESAPVKEDALRSSYSYPSGTTWGLIFDPCGACPDIPTALSSDAAYLSPLRDGMIALGLRPGHAYSAPGFHFLQTQPAMLMAGMLNGATFVHLDLDDLDSGLEPLLRSPLRAMGVCAQVRDGILTSQLDLGAAWGLWFRDPAAIGDDEQWQSFVDATNLGEVAVCNLVWEPSSGGASLFSVRRRGQVHRSVLPSAGVPWSVSDISETGMDILPRFGLLSLSLVGSESGDSLVTGSMIAQTGQEWMYAGSKVSGRRGLRYPQDEVLEAVGAVSGCQCCSICEVAVAGASNSSLFVLLVFMGGSNFNEADVATRIRRSIERDMGHEFLPDRIQFLPLCPRYDSEGGVDHEWCKTEFVSGGLFRRSRDDICLAISALRGQLSEV